MKSLRTLLALLVLACVTASAGPINILSGPRYTAPAGGGGSAPAWFESMTTSRWELITSTNELDDVAVSEPSEGIIDPWTGGCADQGIGSLILPADGGHGDRGGNEVYEYVVRADNPFWRRLSSPSSATGGDPSRNGNGTYADGLIRASHNSTRVICANGRVWVGGMWGMSSGSGLTETTTAVWSWNRESLGSGPFPAATNPWVFHGKGQPSIPGSQVDYSGEGGAVMYDPIGQTFWSVAQYANSDGGFSVDISDEDNPVITAREWDFSGNPFGGGANGTAVSIDSGHRWLIMLSPNEEQLWVLNLNNVAADWRTVGTTNAPADWPDGMGVVYHAASNKLVVYSADDGATIRTITVPADPYTSGAGGFVWGTMTVVGGGVTPPGSVSPDYHGVYDKFQMIDDMGNGRSLLIAVHSSTGSVYGFKPPSTF